MGWLHILDMNTSASTSDNNPFAGPKLQPAGKVLVSMPTDDWLCKNRELNVTLAEGYPSHSSEASGLESIHPTSKHPEQVVRIAHR